MPPFAPPLTILVAAPRPPALGHIPSRMRVEALYDALEAQGQSARAEWLWPPTWDALSKRMREAERPAVAALFVDAILAAAPSGPALYLETGELAGKVVALAELGALLVETGVPMLILSAMPEPSAPADGATPESLGVTLSASGIPHTIIMGPAWSAEQIRQVMSDLWTGLLAGRTVSQAVQEARQGLGSAAGTLYLYQAGEDASLVRPGLQGSGVSKIIHFPASDLAPAWKRLATEPEAGGLPPEPDRDFVGRGREMALVEEALRGSQGNGIVFLSGPEGIGKSTLIAHAARWLVRTGRFTQVVYTDFLGGGYPEVAVHDLGIRLLGEHYDPAGSDLLGSVERALGDTPTLIVWDHLESILPDGPFALPPQATGVAGMHGSGPLGELLELGARFAHTGQSRLVVITDRAELPHPAYTSLDRLSLSMELFGLEASEAIRLLVKPGKDSEGSESLPRAWCG